MNLRSVLIALVLALAGAGLRAAPLPAPKLDGAYLQLGFDLLASFTFVAPDTDPAAKTPPATGESQIPAEIKGWSGRKAVVTGFMLPTKLSNGRATEFLIMANQMACCYGTIPNLNDWVIVRMPAGTPVIQDVPISFYGLFRVGAIYENGFLTGIYEMDAERVGEVK